MVSENSRPDPNAQGLVDQQMASAPLAAQGDEDLEDEGVEDDDDDLDDDDDDLEDDDDLDDDDLDEDDLEDEDDLDEADESDEDEAMADEDAVYGDPGRGVAGASGDAAGQTERTSGSDLSDYLSNEEERSASAATHLPPD